MTIDMSDVKRYIRQSQRSITTHSQAGHDLLERAQPDVNWRDFPSFSIPLPSIIDEPFKSAWAHASKEEHLQVRSG